MLDFSQEEKQKDFVNGPVPAGSVVMVEMEVLQPQETYQAPEDCFVSRSRNGMRMIYCQFRVVQGSYAGVQWRENITLPFAMQHENLNAGQHRACQIGGATLRAILESSGHDLRLRHIREFTGLRFPVKVKISDRPTEKEGNTYWNNAIYKVITPDAPEYQEVKRNGEIINKNGAVSGDAAKAQASKPQNAASPYGAGESRHIDDYVF